MNLAAKNLLRGERMRRPFAWSFLALLSSMLWSGAAQSLSSSNEKDANSSNPRKRVKDLNAEFERAMGRRLQSAACEDNPGCVGLDGNCCPTNDNVVLDCCPDRTCGAYGSCLAAGFPSGDNCCPRDNGNFRPCCASDPEARCDRNTVCRQLGLTGNCCPTDDGVFLDCCFASPPTRRPTRKPTPRPTKPLCIAKGKMCPSQPSSKGKGKGGSKNSEECCNNLECFKTVDTPSLTCKSCRDDGSNCKDSDQCCLGLGCDSNGRCKKSSCKRFDVKCGKPDDCCDDFACLYGSDRCKPCRKNGNSCKRDGDCCGDNICNSNSKKCQKKNACIKSGEDCSSSSECCNKLICLDATETCRACRKDGQRCDVNGDCCNNLICNNNGVCRPSSSCTKLNRACGRSSECCNDLICLRNTKTCKECRDFDFACTVDGDCCGNLECISNRCL